MTIQTLNQIHDTQPDDSTADKKRTRLSLSKEAKFKILNQDEGHEFVFKSDCVSGKSLHTLMNPSHQINHNYDSF